MRIGFLGRTQMLYNTVELLLERGYEIAFIGTCKASPEYSIKEQDFEKIAHTNNIPFFCSTKLKEYKAVMENSADVVLSMNWLTVIDEEIMSLFPNGILNSHPGMLPQYRGNACPNWAIINGEESYAVTIHRMKANELDSGEIIYQKKYTLDESVSITDVYENLYREVPILFLEAIKLLQKEDFKPIIQKDSEASRCYPRIPSDSFIDWNCSSDYIQRVIRASAPPFEGAYTYYKGLKCYVFSCYIEYDDMQRYVYPGQIVYRNEQEGIVKVATLDGNICIQDVYVDGKRHKAHEIFKSTRIRLNYSVQDELFELKNRVEELERIMECVKACYEKTSLN